MTWHIYQLINYSTGEVKPYEPADEVAELVAAIRADRAAATRQRLEALRLPRTRPMAETAPIVDTPPGTALVSELWPGLQELA